MKNFFILILNVLLILNINFLKAQSLSERVTYMQTPVLEDFESQERSKQWVIGNTSPNVDRDITSVKPIKGGPWALAIPKDKKQLCLGVKTGFKSRGYNFIEVLPPIYKTSLYKGIQVLFPDEIPNPNQERFLPIPGRCRTIDMWVAGRNYRYTLEIWLKDFNGFVYALNMGKLDYPGWRDLSVRIPGYINQDEKYIPREKPLKIMKFVLRADPDERAERFYVYFDQLKVFTDVFIQRYDGDDIKDKW